MTLDEFFQAFVFALLAVLLVLAAVLIPVP